MIADFEIVQGDTQPVLQATLVLGSGVVQDLTGATVKFMMWDLDGNIVINDASCTIVGSPTLGVVQYLWLLADTATAGLFYGEFHVTLSGGGKITFPTSGPKTIDIRQRLA